jgi:LemA protein
MASLLILLGGFVGLLLLLILGAYVVSLYNQLVSLKRRVDQAKQNIDVLLKQRQDELSKLVDAVSEYMEHEQDLLESVTKAREQAQQASTPTEQANADQRIRNVMAEFSARMEDYPELRSQANMQQFQERISDLENQISDRREVYNESVTTWNTRIHQFPYLLIAGQMGYQDRELFTASEEETADVDVGAAFDTASSGSGSETGA